MIVEGTTAWNRRSASFAVSGGRGRRPALGAVSAGGQPWLVSLPAEGRAFIVIVRDSRKLDSQRPRPAGWMGGRLQGSYHYSVTPPSPEQGGRGTIPLRRDETRRHEPLRVFAVAGTEHPPLFDTVERRELDLHSFILDGARPSQKWRSHTGMNAEKVRDHWVAELTPPPVAGADGAASEPLLQALMRELGTAAVPILRPDPEHNLDLVGPPPRRPRNGRRVEPAVPKPHAHEPGAPCRVAPPGSARRHDHLPGRRRPSRRLARTRPNCSSTSPAARANACSSSATTTSTRVTNWPWRDSTSNTRQLSATPACDTRPVLILTHSPLQWVPADTVNLHGHIHAAPAPTRHHRNLSVERTGYQPIRLSELLTTDVRPASST